MSRFRSIIENNLEKHFGIKYLPFAVSENMGQQITIMDATIMFNNGSVIFKKSVYDLNRAIKIMAFAEDVKKELEELKEI